MKRLLFLAVAALMSAACCQTSNSEAEAVDNVIMSRRSIRNYKQIPVSRDTKPASTRQTGRTDSRGK